MYEIARKLLTNKNVFSPSPIFSVTIKKFCNVSEKKTNSINAKQNRVRQLKTYWIFRYVDYVKNYEQILEKNFPRTMNVYRVFSVGTKEFYRDLKQFLKVRKKQRKFGINSLNREELQLIFSMPGDLIKISPILLLSAVPFTNYVIFPLVFYFPHVLLTSHYWSIQDKLNFMMKEHKKKLKHYKPLFRCLQAQVVSIKDPNLNEHFRKAIVGRLGSGTHPSTNDILSCISLFSGAPFSLDSLQRNHIKQLLLIHNMRRFGFNNRKRLLRRGEMLKLMDIAIIKEGGVTKLPYEAMRLALSIRGLNPANMSIDDMQTWLNQWLIVSTNVELNSISLLLHCPILLTYNHETNWTLLYHK